MRPASPNAGAPARTEGNPSDDDADATDDDRQEAGPAAGGPVALASGTFESRGRYSGQGTATIYQLEDGSRTLRLEDFETTNGPDLFVWLSGATSADPDDAHDVVYYNLGDLRGNVGNQNYDIPDDVNLDDYASVIIWCERFSTGFAAADLS